MSAKRTFEKMNSGASATGYAKAKRPKLVPEMDQYPIEVISLVGEQMYTEDRLNVQTAFPHTKTCQAMASSRQKRLCLFIDENGRHYHKTTADLYHLKRKFNVPLLLPPSKFADKGGVPSDDEAKYVIGRELLLKTSTRRVVTSNGAVEELKIVLGGGRHSTATTVTGEHLWLKGKVLKVLAAYSRQLTSLAIILRRSSSTASLTDDDRGGHQHLSQLCAVISALNGAHFPRLKHFLLVDGAFDSCLEIPLKLLTTCSQLEEVYLQLHGNLLLAQLPALAASRALRRFGFIVNELLENRVIPALGDAAGGDVGGGGDGGGDLRRKLVHMASTADLLAILPVNPAHQPLLAGHNLDLAAFSALTHGEFCVDSIARYRSLLTGLQELGQLRCLRLILHYQSDRVLLQEGGEGGLHQDLLHPMPALPSVTSLRLAILERNSRADVDSLLTHRILVQLAVIRQFVGLRSFGVFLAGRCTLCRTFLYDEDCVRLLLEPLSALTELREIGAETHRPINCQQVVERILAEVKGRRDLAAAEAANQANKNVF